MWYQFSQEQTYILIQGLNALAEAEAKKGVWVPQLEDLKRKLYDFGELRIPLGSDDKRFVY